MHRQAVVPQVTREPAFVLLAEPILEQGLLGVLNAMAVAVRRLQGHAAVRLVEHQALAELVCSDDQHVALGGVAGYPERLGIGLHALDAGGQHLHLVPPQGQEPLKDQDRVRRDLDHHVELAVAQDIHGGVGLVPDHQGAIGPLGRGRC